MGNQMSYRALQFLARQTMETASSQAKITSIGEERNQFGFAKVISTCHCSCFRYHLLAKVLGLEREAA